MRGHAFRFLVLLAVIALVLAGCTPAPTPAPAQAAATAVGQAQAKVSTFALAGSEWKLDSLVAGTVPLTPGVESTLGFTADRYMGFAGCDYFVGMYKTESGTLSLKSPAMTASGCVNTADAKSQQANYMSSLGNVLSYGMDGEKLVLYTAGNQPLLTFVPLKDLPLEGTPWELSFYYAAQSDTWVPGLPDAPISAKFDGKTLSGNAGCNDYNAPYTLDGEKLSLGPIAVTQKVCSEPSQVMEQEAAYLRVLKSSTALQKFARSVLLGSDGHGQLMYHVAPAK